MSVKVTRRTVLRGSAAMALSGAAGHSARRFDADPEITAAEEEATVHIALLDLHARRLEPLLAEFVAESGIDLEITALRYNELYMQLSLALTQQAPTFDVVSIEDAWVPQFASLLTPRADEDDSIAAMVSIATELARYPDESDPCGIPWLGDAQFLVTRDEWLQGAGVESPTTWDAVVEYARSFDAARENPDETAAFAITLLDAHQLVDSFLPVLRGFGIDLIDPATSVPQLDTLEALAAIDVFQELAASSPEESGATGAPTNIDRFQAGSIAMMSNYWSSNLLASREVEQLIESGPAFANLQPSQGSVPRRSMSGVWVAGIPVGSGRQESARSLVSWLVSEETQRRLIGRSLPPVIESVYADPLLIEVAPHLPHLYDLLAHSTPRPRSPYYTQLEQLLAIELEALLSGDQTTEDAMRNANIAMREFLTREGILSV